MILRAGEDKGLPGSRYYTEKPTVPQLKIRLNVNFDKISRYISDDEHEKVTMTYSETCPEFKGNTEKNIS
ncbi:MAG TPA: hypothetical protein VMW76_08595 [Bacteroidales bacterium]|nr:hypothetical protein [Bacteroidales bacterium]